MKNTSESISAGMEALAGLLSLLFMVGEVKDKEKKDKNER